MTSALRTGESTPLRVSKGTSHPSWFLLVFVAHDQFYWTCLAIPALVHYPVSPSPHGLPHTHIVKMPPYPVILQPLVRLQHTSTMCAQKLHCGFHKWNKMKKPWEAMIIFWQPWSNFWCDYIIDIIIKSHTSNLPVHNVGGWQHNCHCCLHF
jgi:hypothetical protein